MTNEELMELAIQEAISAKNIGEVPIGAVIEVDGQVISSRHNERETTNDPTAHAEILALRTAVHTARTAGFHTIWLVVQDEAGVQHGVRLSIATPKAATKQEKSKPSGAVKTAHWANPTVVIHSGKGLMFSAFDTDIASHRTASLQNL